MNGDITDILKGWEFDSDNQIRIIQADDGRQVLQVRQPLGIEQYELDGRPDGREPFGRPTMLDEIRARLESHRGARGTDEGFAISHDDFAPLQSEGLLFYFRYLVLFQIGDFVRTSRDTEHNLALCDLVERYAESEDDRKELLQHRPYILRMNAISRAMISLHKEMKAAAEEILAGAINAIEGMAEIDTPAFQFEKIRSINSLKATLRQIQEQKVRPLDKLRADLEQAVEDEDYETAAQIRDRIRALENAGGSREDAPDDTG